MSLITRIITGLLMTSPFWVLLIWSLMGEAQGNEISIILGSHHFNAKEDYNESNPGICYQHKIYLGCHYKNSFNEKSTSLGLRKKFGSYKNILYGGTVAYVDGYDKPMIWISFDLEWEHGTLSFIPGEIADSKNVIVYGIKF